VAVAKIADPYFTGELTKTGGSQCHPPGRIELPVLDVVPIG
jgi:hypothetical protein